MYQRTTFNVVFFCKKTKISKKGKAPIYARITTSGQTTEIYTQCQIEPERWNQRLERSLYKDEVDLQINRIIASYRASILAAYDRLIQPSMEREIRTEDVGEKVMDRLRKVDQVAYVRFASVYRQFKDLDTFMAELNKLLAEK